MGELLAEDRVRGVWERSGRKEKEGIMGFGSVHDSREPTFSRGRLERRRRKDCAIRGMFSLQKNKLPVTR